MRFRLGIGSKAKRLFFSSQGKGKPANGENPVGEFEFRSKVVDSGFGYRGSDFGSKEEIFFDSKAWLDSDCEDDFYSVNGEFTPSRGTTPNYQFSTPVAPQFNKSLFLDTFPDTKSEPSPADGKKKLIELLQDSFPGDVMGNEPADGKVESNGKPGGYKLSTDQPPKSSEGTPYLSGSNSGGSNEATPNNKKERTRKSTQCCFPSFVPSLGFNDKKQKMSPER